MADDVAKVLMAVIGAPHGVRGEVRVKSFTGDPLALGDYGPLSDKSGRRFTLVDIRPAKTVVVARFKEIGDRNAAEAAAGTELFVARAALPDDLDEDEFYHADLIGLSAVDETGAGLGTVKAIHDFGAGEMVEIQLAAGGSVMVPFTRAAVPAISLADGTVTVDRAAAGLLDTSQENEP